MTRYHEVYDFSQGPDATPSLVPFTADEEAAADAVKAALSDLQPFQFRAMLQLSGHQAALDAYVAGLSDPAKTIAQAKLDYSLTFERQNPLVLAAQQAIGLTSDQLDALWVQAAAIS